MFRSFRQGGSTVRSRIYTTSRMERSMLYPPSTIRTQPTRPRTTPMRRSSFLYHSGDPNYRNESDIVNEFRAQDDYR